MRKLTVAQKALLAEIGGKGLGWHCVNLSWCGPTFASLLRRGLIVTDAGVAERMNVALTDAGSVDLESIRREGEKR